MITKWKIIKNICQKVILWLQVSIIYRRLGNRHQLLRMTTASITKKRNIFSLLLCFCFLLFFLFVRNKTKKREKKSWLFLNGLVLRRIQLRSSRHWFAAITTATAVTVATITMIRRTKLTSKNCGGVKNLYNQEKKNKIKVSENKLGIRMEK